MSELSLSHHFLIAMPHMDDPFFARAVVYLCEHSERGAMGMVINRPSDMTMATLYRQIGLTLDQPQFADLPVYYGGPVQSDRGFVLHEPIGNWQSTLTVTDDVAMTTSKDILTDTGKGQGPERFIVTLGYAGWEAGQLEHELSHNGWLTVPADMRIAFDLPPEDRYDAAMKLLGFDPLALFGQAGHA
ncbi:YqgE/AlgH family protein [Microvirgula aerodenitrificans]|uniref:YqgE/AlgH family protein n=1 Tax=Microvirgula aerodenitrificans TaxID=57480 RepID=UPI00248DA0EE|nr:YqgE/AlgH family protein [Microvirgula aerodenitrificans]